MGQVRPLICIPSPRDIPITQKAFDVLDFDIFWSKYYPEKLAYPLFRDFFLDHKEYTHLVIAPDDLVVSNENMYLLMHDLEQFDYPVLSGVCNINHEPANAGKWNIVRNEVISPRRSARIYHWIHDSEYDPANPIVKVKFSGFPLMFIRRDIIERVPFKDDCEANGLMGTGGGLDVIFCFDCDRLDIPIHADMRCKMDHLSGEYRDLKVGKEKPYTKFDPA